MFGRYKKISSKTASYANKLANAFPTFKTKAKYWIILANVLLFLYSATTATVLVDSAPTGQIGSYNWYRKCSIVNCLNLKMVPYMERRLLVGVLVEQFV